MLEKHSQKFPILGNIGRVCNFLPLSLKSESCEIWAYGVDQLLRTRKSKKSQADRREDCHRTCHRITSTFGIVSSGVP